jgi:predicted nucleic acid-binding protein
LFIDTSYWIALAVARDAYHTVALAWENKTTAQPVSLFTTEAVLWETLNSLSSQSLKSRGAELYRRVHDDPAITVVGFEPELCDQAVQSYANHTDKDWGVIDCLSFVVMRLHGIVQALTADHHFEQAGFAALLRGKPSDDVLR